MSRRLVFATGNAKKLDELRRIAEPELSGIQVLGLNDIAAYDEPAETESTFAGNALLKARAAVTHAGLPAVADDSGLCVDALNAMPGVFSARWSGRPTNDRPTNDRRNNELLLEQLSDVPDDRRGAAFVCQVALVMPDGSEHLAEGELRGQVLRAPRGNGGFGYDPIFAPDGQGAAIAELDAAAKDRISHRGQALRALLPTLVTVLRR